ncbi:MAG: GDSL-type esterase/lipase family protein [Candidatus ainarchaeum sp.]|nr:GDSL-type esterase/lipase family protein [Candidatus ainarchaeum sp.]
MAVICVFGDSFAVGASDHKKGGWADQLKIHFLKTNDEVVVYNLGIHGNITNDLVARFGEIKTRNPDIIIFQIGINDSSCRNNGKNPRTTLEQFEKNIIKLISLSKKAKTKQIIFLGISRVIDSMVQPYLYSPNKTHFSNLRIETYDSLLQKLCKKNKVQYLETASLLSQSELKYDGLHPGPKYHKRVYEKVKHLLSL